MNPKHRHAPNTDNASQTNNSFYENCTPRIGYIYTLDISGDLDALMPDAVPTCDTEGVTTPVVGFVFDNRKDAQAFIFANGILEALPADNILNPEIIDAFYTASD